MPSITHVNLRDLRETMPSITRVNPGALRETILLRFSPDAPNQSFDILPHNIKFKINNGTGTNSIEIGVLVSIRDDGNGETTVMRIETGEAYAIHGNRSFFNGDVTRFRIVFKIKTPTSIFINDRRANPCLIHMALNDVTVKTAVGNQAPFEIDAVPYLPASQN